MSLENNRVKFHLSSSYTTGGLKTLDNYLPQYSPINYLGNKYVNINNNSEKKYVNINNISKIKQNVVNNKKIKFLIENTMFNSIIDSTKIQLYDPTGNGNCFFNSIATFLNAENKLAKITDQQLRIQIADHFKVYFSTANEQNYITLQLIITSNYIYGNEQDRNNYRYFAPFVKLDKNNIDNYEIIINDIKVNEFAEMIMKNRNLYWGDELATILFEDIYKNYSIQTFMFNNNFEVIEENPYDTVLSNTTYITENSKYNTIISLFYIGQHYNLFLNSISEIIAEYSIKQEEEDIFKITNIEEQKKILQQFEKNKSISEEQEEILKNVDIEEQKRILEQFNPKSTKKSKNIPLLKNPFSSSSNVPFSFNNPSKSNVSSPKNPFAQSSSKVPFSFNNTPTSNVTSSLKNPFASSLSSSNASFSFNNSSTLSKTPFSFNNSSVSNISSPPVKNPFAYSSSSNAQFVFNNPSTSNVSSSPLKNPFASSNAPTNFSKPYLIRNNLPSISSNVKNSTQNLSNNPLKKYK